MSPIRKERDPGDTATTAARRGAAWSQRAKAAILGASLLVTTLIIAGCTEGPNMLDPSGPVASRIADLWWFMFWLGTAVFIVVTALLLIAIFRGRRDPAISPDAFHGTRLVVWGGIVVPTIILAAVLAFTFHTILATAEPNPGTDFTIEVVGHQYWWEVRYPDHDFVTANEIHIPVGRPVEVRLTSNDVIHSFWVPELTSKRDLIPGQSNSLWMEASDAGEYRGICAEFCGAQHARMHFLVIAEEPDDFDQWVANQQQPAAEPATESVQRGQQIFLGSACIYCHRVEGTVAQGELGPDLTHLASRRTLAAGWMENNRGNLAGWIVDPQAIKPGNLMPGIDLDSEDLQALLTYLESLE